MMVETFGVSTKQTNSMFPVVLTIFVPIDFLELRDQFLRSQGTCLDCLGFSFKAEASGHLISWSDFAVPAICEQILCVTGDLTLYTADDRQRIDGSPSHFS